MQRENAAKNLFKQVISVFIALTCVLFFAGKAHAEISGQPIDVNIEAAGDSAVTISFLTESGVDYGIETSTDMINWIPEITVTGEGDIISLIDQAAVEPVKFYRVFEMPAVSSAGQPASSVSGSANSGHYSAPAGSGYSYASADDGYSYASMGKASDNPSSTFIRGPVNFLSAGSTENAASGNAFGSTREAGSGFFSEDADNDAGVSSSGPDTKTDRGSLGKGAYSSRPWYHFRKH